MPFLSFGILAMPLVFSLLTTAAALPGRPVPRQGIGFTHLGCFADSADRVLAAGFKGDDHMTVGMCADHCYSFKYFGMEYGRECTAAMSRSPLPWPSPAPSATCPVPAMPRRVVVLDDASSSSPTTATPALRLPLTPAPHSWAASPMPATACFPTASSRWTT